MQGIIPSEWRKARFAVNGVVRVRGLVEGWVFEGHRCEVGDRAGELVLVKTHKYGRAYTFWAHRSDLAIEKQDNTNRFYGFWKKS